MKDKDEKKKREREQYKNLVLDAWNRIEGKERRDFIRHKKEVERLNRKKW